MAAKEKEVKSLLIDVKKSSRCNSHSALVCLNVLLVAVIVCMAVFILTANITHKAATAAALKLHEMRP